ncbi:MaoC/PaaZ C-terminal domain-containing protein [Sulfoacidibacillus thermotolerans]|uniref:MaoC-like domain-containing protein n=1 Tax=Sulfoacidibacillus thermotolerans TaxID=1765684 RepID=A0A2U3DBM2_SULT2|nr:MaoC/PaaZ C-terminal domain-containing protein [Sulfoacidibacillus thermotolerans]PWI58673.1 hypothetical protein BM613_00805 [Sulfoacidibacillus thermotolerans]
MYFHEFFVGQRFTLNSVTLTSEEIEEFAQRYDPQPIHIDPVFSQNGFFKGIIASGLHTLSVIWGEWIRSNRFGSEIIGGTGLDFVHWTNPVRPGDALQTEVEVTETKLSSRGDRGLVVLKFTVKNQHEEIVLTTQARAYVKNS